MGPSARFRQRSLLNEGIRKRDPEIRCPKERPKPVPASLEVSVRRFYRSLTSRLMSRLGTIAENRLGKFEGVAPY
jgi:hypothetical protein